MSGEPEEPDTRTSHVACRCPPCGACFVVATLPAEAGVMSKRLLRATCPDCGNTDGLQWALNDHHRAAVARLRREAALD